MVSDPAPAGAISCAAEEALENADGFGGRRSERVVVMPPPMVPGSVSSSGGARPTLTVPV
jgi:hypothetical protein